MISPNFGCDIWNGMAKFWCKQQENKDPSCLISRFQLLLVVQVQGIFSGHSLGNLHSLPEYCG